MRRPLASTYLLAGLAFATSVSYASAGVVASQIHGVEAAPAANASLPLDFSLTDDAGHSVTVRDAIRGRPAVVVFVDYTCRTLCGPILEFTLAGLAKTGLKPGFDYRLIAIGIDPRDRSTDARAMRESHIEQSNPINRAATFLMGDESETRAVTQAAGFQYAYDSEHDQYAHPAAVYVVDGEGRIRRVLSPLGLDGADLRLAIVDAARGSVGTLADRIHLLCYGYDPVRGIYTDRITTMLAFAAGTTLVALLGGISLLAAHHQRGRS
jgi:protein SCO1